MGVAHSNRFRIELNRSGYCCLFSGVLILCFALGFSGCKSKLDQVADKPIPVSPNYREDEQIRLQLFVEDVLQLEKNKQYSALYDRYTAPVFKKSISRRNFLRVSQCVEESLGGVQDYHRKNWVFQKKNMASILASSKQPPTQPPQVVHLIERKVTRSKATLMERFSIVGNGLEYQLSGLYWMTKKNDFLTCVKNLNPPEQQAPNNLEKEETGKEKNKATQAKSLEKTVPQKKQ